MGGVRRLRHGFSMLRVRGGGIDRNGHRVPELEPVEFRAAFAPGVSTEDVTHRTETSTKATLYLEEIVDITDQDTIRTTLPAAGEWHVDGDPEIWISPYTGMTAGMVVILKRQKG